MYFTSDELFPIIHNLREKLIRNDCRPKHKIHQVCIGAQIHFSPTFCTTSISRHKSCGIYECAILSSLFSSTFLAFTGSNKILIFDQVDVVCMMHILAWGYKIQNIDPQWHEGMKIRKLRVTNLKQDGLKPNEVAEYWWEPGFQNMTDRHGRV